jgi:hypothetical protein
MAKYSWRNLLIVKLSRTYAPELIFTVIIEDIGFNLEVGTVKKFQNHGTLDLRIRACSRNIRHLSGDSLNAAIFYLGCP